MDKMGIVYHVYHGIESACGHHVGTIWCLMLHHRKRRALF